MQHNKSINSLKSEQLSLVNARLYSEESQEISFTFRAGRIYLITGSNGAGKTTLLHRLAGVEPIAGGSITLGDKSLLNENWRRKQQWNKEVICCIQFVSQHVEDTWFGGTVQQELELIMHHYRKSFSDVEAELTKRLLAFGITNEMREQELNSLSVGQQKRLALAIAFALPFDWLLLDEPMAGLDYVGKQELIKSVEESKQKGKGIIIVSHQVQELSEVVDEKLIVDETGLHELLDAPIPTDEAVFNRLLQSSLTAKSSTMEDRPELPEEVTKQVGLGLYSEGSTGLYQLGEVASDSEVRGVLPVKDRHARERFIMKQATMFDPRALMLGMLICSTSLVIWSSWLGLVLYGVLAIVTSVLLKESLKRWSGLIIAYTVMSCIFAFVGGLSLSPIAFNLDSALSISQRMLSLLIIIVLGLPLLQLMTPFRLQRALQQSLTPLRRLGVPINSYALLVSLIFRLIPILSRRWQVLASLCRTRYKQTGIVSWRMMNALIIAYMQSLLQVADQVATSLEYRGFERTNGPSMHYVKVQWQKQDSFLLLALIFITIVNAAIY